MLDQETVRFQQITSKEVVFAEKTHVPDICVSEYDIPVTCFKDDI